MAIRPLYTCSSHAIRLSSLPSLGTARVLYAEARPLSPCEAEIRLLPQQQQLVPGPAYLSLVTADLILDCSGPKAEERDTDVHHMMHYILID
jgi:hypothetical protein